MLSQIHVRKNQPLTIDKTFPNPLIIDELIMDDDSRIIVECDLEVHVTQSVTIGRRCLIEASGLRGLDGDDALGVPPQAEQITPGKTGYPGGDGKPGGRGWNMSFIWSISTIGDCLIRANGGAGGDGGNGGEGGKGGGALCIGGDGRPGGEGGIGGHGGRGGDSGKVKLTWNGARFSSLAESLEKNLGALSGAAEPEIAGVPIGLRFEVNPGNGGRGGQGGPGGRGGDGVDCGFYGKGGGPQGGQGRAGRGGRNGMTIAPDVKLG